MECQSQLMGLYRCSILVLFRGGNVFEPRPQKRIRAPFLKRLFATCIF